MNDDNVLVAAMWGNEKHKGDSDVHLLVYDDGRYEILQPDEAEQRLLANPTKQFGDGITPPEVIVWQPHGEDAPEDRMLWRRQKFGVIRLLAELTLLLPKLKKSFKLTFYCTDLTNIIHCE